MADERELVTVFRSAEMDGEGEADQIHNLLIEAGLRSGVFDDSVPGVIAGTWEVRVPAEEAARAEQIIASNAAAAELEESAASPADSSPEFDAVTVFRSMGTLAEMQALSLQGLLESNGIDAMLVGDSMLPQLGFEIRVARERVDEARAIIQQAEASGPEAAAEEAERTAPEA